ncbi:PcfJ domain-containing protein [Hymenobacter metallilatus]|uniref:PcfJ-like protein n=1 Tax=Hymenobacter metallilatus TaxID=2493666 RepID=A0A428IZM9_9BACT|nr:PcfJ domain-containing protein [Hymenobacter metallilatus]RSK24779.1 hypothetical protein EI290_19195 [Hymenobacter metallilatus]
MSNRTKPLSAQAQATERALTVLANRPSSRKWSVLRQIQAICVGRSVAAVHALLEPDSVGALVYCHCLQGRPNAEQARARTALLALAAHTPHLFTEPRLVPALAALVRWYHCRRRELVEWQPRRRNVYRQLYSLVRHLFDEFGDVPGWVIEAWATGQLEQSGADMARLTLHLGRGQALRTFAELPETLSRRLEHEMRQAPYEYTLVQALRYAQLATRQALPLLEAVLATRFGRETSPDDAFWLRVVEFFRDAPMVDASQFGPVCEWLHVKRTVGTDGEPPQPGLSLKGRSMAAVLAQSGHWHRRTHRARRYWGYDVALHTAWSGLPVPDYAPTATGRIRIVQLRSYAELLEEGSAQKHCVSSYVYSCLRGQCGIFSLRINGVRALTLEVRANRQLVQVRGRENRRATEAERQWLEQWAAVAGLSLSATA